jgi:predicted SnoaL-like aldol condensation-catalyzing enzyme
MRIFPNSDLKTNNMTKEEKNKALVLEAFETAFNKRDESAYEKYWSPNYIQHSAHIEPGREGLKKIMSATPVNMRYEHGVIVAEGDFVMVHGRYTNIGLPRPWVIVDIIRIENGLLAEHWDVIQDEATAAESKSGKPMFGEEFRD